MAEFGVSTTLEAEVDQQSLRQARQEIEAELGDIEVSVTAEGSPSQSVGRGGSSRGFAKVNTLLDDLDTKALRRNELLEDLLDATEQGDFTRATGGGAGGVLGGLFLGGLGLLGGALSGLGDFELEPPDIPPLEPPKIPPVVVDKPDWLPLGVPEPDWLPIEVTFPDESPDSSPITPRVPYIDQTPYPEPAPTPAPGPVTDPLFTPGEGNPVEQVDPSPSPSPTFPTIGVPEAILGGGAAVGGALALKQLAGATRGGSSAAAPIAAPSVIAARAGRDAQNTPDDQQNIVQRFFDRLVPDLDRNRAMRMSTATATSTASISARENRAGSGSDVTIEHSPTYEVSGLDEVRRKQEQDRRELEQKIDRLQQSLSGPSTSGGF